MKEKPYVKVAMYALNIIFAIIIIVPVVSSDVTFKYTDTSL